MQLSLSVNNQSVDSSGITNDYKEAINEFIWNGFEANASKVVVDFSQNELSGISELVIRDDGDGINYGELKETFGAFLASKKSLLSLNAKSRVNRGKGRFSFIAFAGNAVWKTVYKAGSEFKQFTISMFADKKEVAECSEPEISEDKSTGTEVVFTNINSLTVASMNFKTMEPFLLQEFAWFLYLYRRKKLEIIFNREKLDYSKYINTELSETIRKTIKDQEFEISLVVWQKTINEKFCCYYFNESNVLKGKDTTNFNRNTINFNHSVYVKSDFFNGVDHVPDDGQDHQMDVFLTEEVKEIFGKLNAEIRTLIEKKMSIYLSEKAEKIVEEMITERKTFPTFPNDIYGQMQLNDLKRVTKEIYKLEPLIFYRLKPIQEKSILGFLNLLLSSEEREDVLTIIEQVVKLSPEQRKKFADMLKKTELENIIDTIKFLEERFRVIEVLRSIVYDLTKYANERDHIQKLVERHFWLFGEQYNLASADQRMKKALEKYTNILYGENNIEAALKPDVENERRIDIFLCNKRWVESSFGACEEENIIVELKAPKVVLTKNVYRQIEDYMIFVKDQPAFNSIKRKWKFIAVCLKIDDYIKSKYKMLENVGKVGLVCQSDNYEIYALTWDDVMKSFEIRYKDLLNKLKYDREQVANELMEEVREMDGREKANVLTRSVLSAS